MTRDEEKSMERLRKAREAIDEIKHAREMGRREAREDPMWGDL